MISIVIPLYNREALVGETLDSVLAQTYADWECVVVDDGSTDGSREVVQKYCEKDSRFKMFRRPETRVKGAATCRNVGIENSSGEFIYFLDSDDLLSPKFMKTVLEGITGEPGLEYVAFPFDAFFDSPDKPIYYSRKFLPGKGSLREQVLVNQVIPRTQPFFWTRSLLEKSPMKWREGFLLEDIDFVKRMVCLAEKGIWLEIPALIHIRQGNGDSMGAYYRKHLDERVNDQVFGESEAYRTCSEMGIMTEKIHRRFLYGILRFQIFFAVLSGHGKLLKPCYEFLREHKKNTFYDNGLCLLSRIALVVTPLLYLGGVLGCYLPFYGKQFVRAKKKW